MTHYDEAIEHLFMEHFGIHWSGSATDKSPDLPESIQFNALREFAENVAMDEQEALLGGDF